MAIHLSEKMLFGELFNLKRNSTHGYFVLRDDPLVYRFDLTGDPGPEFQGRQFRFMAADVDASVFEELDKAFERQAPEGEPFDGCDCGCEHSEDAAAGTGAEDWLNDTPFGWDGPKPFIQPQQIGPTGEMDLRWVRMLPDGVAVKEVLDSNESIETYWELSLCLEWYSQNGRVVTELPNPRILLIKGEPIPEPPLDPEDRGKPALGITRIEKKGDDEFTVHHTEHAAKPEGEEETLEEALERRNREVEASFRGGEMDPLEAAKLMDHLIEHEPGEFAGSVPRPQRLPKPDEVDEERATILVKSLLAELALCGIAVHICEHYTMTEAYKFLVEEILLKQRVHPQLRGTGWVQGFMTHESCPICMAETEAEYGGGTKPAGDPES
ncbi:hypothetical protein HZA57_06840 [Candidatus Poribacteria bacterium]|nr:hypothetical protein [Candidatus Poribacteria bacterium]